MRKDKLLVTVSIGAISTIPAEILSRFLVYSGIGKYSIYQLGSLFITFNRPNIIIGLIVDSLVGGSVAYLFYLALEKVGSDYLIIKAIMVGLIVWIVCEIMLTATIEGRFFDLRPIGDYYNNILCAGIFGSTLGLLFEKFLFKKAIS